MNVSNQYCFGMNYFFLWYYYYYKS
jgi:hypothetical protein